ncbi:amidohydrolase family protein, partial [Actinophytocola sp.]|uniref:amidohydrolase family protein n=1 Tax=Actinophytocola sp. TaxID=1872138 RepID=UPI002D80FB04
SVQQAVAATATRPAELLGLADVTGSITAGRAADLVLLDASLRPTAVLHRGAWVD